MNRVLSLLTCGLLKPRFAAADGPALMTRKWIRIVAWLALASTTTCGVAAGQGELPATNGTWAFQPPKEFGASMIDLRGLNERVAGDKGFLRVSDDGNDLVRGDGKIMRIWGVAASIDENTSDKDLARHAAFLARMGVNMVRIGGATAGLIPQKPGSKLTDVNASFLNDVWRLVAAMKKEGIYVRISPLWDHGSVKYIGADWGLEGYQSGNGINGLLFFEPHLKEGYRAWMKKLLTETNPYTGIALKDDPALAVVQVVSEDTLFFWWTDTIKGGPRRELERRFAAFARRKYGSIEKALAAWRGVAVRGDAPQAGCLALFPTFELTKGNGSPRLSDQVEFMASTERGFFVDMKNYLQKELGARQLIAASNFGSADPVRLHDVERWAWSAGDIVEMNDFAANNHSGANSAWRIEAGDIYRSQSATRTGQFPACKKQVAGKPFVISSSNWVLPNDYAMEGPVLSAAYGAMTGLDGFFWFAASAPAYGDLTLPWATIKGSHPLFKWTISHPAFISQFPAAALIFREGLVERAATVAHEERSLKSLFAGGIPLQTDSSDPKIAAGRADGRLHLAGRVEVVLGGDSDRSTVADLKAMIDKSTGDVRTTHGQLALNMQRGLLKINAPRAQGVVGFLREAGGTYALADVEVKSGNTFASVVCVAMDARSLGKSEKILVQVGTQATPTGWQTRPMNVNGREGMEIVSTGTMPWRIMNTDMELKIANPGLTKASVLNEYGELAGPLVIEEGKERMSREAAGRGDVRPTDTLGVPRHCD